MGVSKHLLSQVKTIYGEKFPEKLRNISEHADKYAKKYYGSDQFNVLVCGSQLLDITANYFVDVHRFKERRDMTENQISAGKVAAFTAKWIVKLRPICVEPAENFALSSSDRFSALYANELFAIDQAEHLIGIKFQEKLYKELAFEFRQKKMSETQLYMTFEQAMGFYGNN